MAPISLYIVEDELIIAHDLKAKLNEFGYDVLGIDTKGESAIENIANLQESNIEPDIVIMDIAMPILNGIQAARQIKQSELKTKVIILSMHDHTRYIRELLSIGVSGYLLKNAASGDIIKAIHAVIKGESYLSPTISNRVIEDYVGMNKKTSQDELYNTLTNREREVFQMMVEGYPTKEIAETLCLSPSTVKSHRSNIMEKLKMDNISKLIQYAIQLGIIDIQI